MKVRIGLYPGSFDPPTFGHLDIIKRSCSLVDRLIVAIASNGSKDNSLFSLSERIDLLNNLLNEQKNILVTSFSGLAVDFAKANLATVIIRGLRDVNDWNNERQMAQINAILGNNIETIFLPSTLSHQIISSTAAKIICQAGGDLTAFVPTIVKEQLHKKMFAQ